MFQNMTDLSMKKVIFKILPVHLELRYDLFVISISIIKHIMN